MCPGEALTAEAPATVPRALLIAEVWAELGSELAPLSNGLGQPLARTVKLLLDPLVLRPVLNPRFAAGQVRGEDAEELRATLRAAGPRLAATAAWFTRLKRARRTLRISEGNPQDLYFQRCFELAGTLGPPGADAERVACEVVAEIRESAGELTVAALRRHITDPARAAELRARLAHAWASRAPVGQPPPDQAALTAALDGVLDRVAGGVDRAALDGLVAGRAGAADAVSLLPPGAALACGLTLRERIEPPALGESASKRNLPPPFDRSVFERLFAGFTSAFHRESMPGLSELVLQEVRRSAEPWQLAREETRVTMALGRRASAALAPGGEAGSDAGARLAARWRREPFVHRALRLPRAEGGGPGESVGRVREAYLRRLWVRVHGRELREEPVAAEDLWDLLDGVLRSVIMDQRDRLRAELDRAGGAATDGGER
ncbi:hypothetical protein SAMN06297387_11096 [Streptomyces zhaozhouensis]|uniref:Uncharacterized protein n=1 Tax=Streptomyces zhaozhouensis TaxID=1300267 RepID=A0A286DXT7_9ACTN|nr:hypothetical protein [Streptomyces zhaozhouensis]SOD63364.1 hypothetical protein SAMN06297387_11096 [Streptomyces zhaozhouensis]